MPNELCAESKDMALFTALVALARALRASGSLDPSEFHAQLDQAHAWLRERGGPHDAKAFEALLPMLKDV